MRDLEGRKEKCRRYKSHHLTEGRKKHQRRCSTSRSRSRSPKPHHHHSEEKCKRRRREDDRRQRQMREEEERVRVKEEPPSEEEEPPLITSENVPSNQRLQQEPEPRESVSKVPRSRWEYDESTEDRDARLGRTRPTGGRANKEGAIKWGKEGEEEDKKKKGVENKAKPDFGLSGKLAEEVNTYKGVVIKYSEPAEARIPKTRWRLYPFKGDENLPTMYIHRQSGYLIGRERKIADIPIDHPSCSKQHAVLQYRLVPYTRSDGTKGQRIRPYLIDLESANGTYVNNKKIDPRKYVELLEKDVLKFAYSSREYVLLHEHSKDDILDDDPVE